MLYDEKCEVDEADPAFPEQRTISTIARAAVGLPVNFSLLVMIDALYHGADVWDGNGEELVRNGTASFDALLGCREDVWDLIVSHLPAEGSLGTRLPLQIMENVRMGRYAREYASNKRAMNGELERILSELQVPKWYFYHIQKIAYLFPKAHCIAYLCKTLERTWYQLQAQAE